LIESVASYSRFDSFIKMCLHKLVKLITNNVPVRKFYIELMFVSVRVQFHNHVDTQPVKRFDRAM